MPRSYRVLNRLVHIGQVPAQLLRVALVLDAQRFDLLALQDLQVLVLVALDLFLINEHLHFLDLLRQFLVEHFLGLERLGQITQRLVVQLQSVVFHEQVVVCFVDLVLDLYLVLFYFSVLGLQLSDFAPVLVVLHLGQFKVVFVADDLTFHVSQLHLFLVEFVVEALNFRLQIVEANLVAHS